MKAKTRFTKEYNEAPYEEKLIFAASFPEILKPKFARRFKTLEDAQKSKPVQMFEEIEKDKPS